MARDPSVAVAGAKVRLMKLRLVHAGNANRFMRDILEASPLKHANWERMLKLSTTSSHAIEIPHMS